MAQKKLPPADPPLYHSCSSARQWARACRPKSPFGAVFGQNGREHCLRTSSKYAHLQNTYISKTRTSQNTYISKTPTSPKYTYIFKRALLTYISPLQNPSLISIVITKTAVLGGEQLCWFHHHDITVTTLRNKAIGNRLGSLANGYCNLESVI